MLVECLGRVLRRASNSGRAATVAFYQTGLSVKQICAE